MSRNEIWQTQLNSQFNKIEQHWLTRTDSLTRALEQRTQSKIQIKLIYNAQGLALSHEQLKLGLEKKESFFIREIQLFASQRLFIIARSVIPVSTLKATHYVLAELGTSSLGHFLFHYPHMQREPLEFMNSLTALKEYTCLKKYTACFLSMVARRSLFQLNGCPLLLTEFFMPSFKEVLHVI